ncbi:tyrosine-type recombinase/integrase [Thermophilibacter provencensis]|uniref:tyrosine-type recombinase/integrase n=1 Tax=Thermophilibacter provencensis TaxID=1852386 RepID=UPI003AA8AA06
MKYTSAFLRGDSSKGWRGVLKYRDEDGTWRQRQKKLSATGKREAQKELASWRAEMEEEALWHVPGAKRPGNVGEFVSQYIDTLKHAQAVELSTLTPYRAMQKHIADGLGDVPFEKLDSDTTQAWVNRMAENGYAPSTIRKALNLLKAAYADALNRRAIPYNPIVGVKSPKLIKGEPNALDAEQRAKLLAYLEIASKTPVNLAIRIALGTGMREQEICGLRWKDVDLKAGVLHVRNVIGRDGGKTYEKEPKTGGSRRDIPISPELAEALHERLSQMMEECMDAGIAMTPNHHVVGSIDGKYMRPHTLWREWKAIAKSLGLVGTEGKVPVFHDLRHTFATAAIASGADVKSVSSILGHSNAAMTLNIYASADAEAKRRAMERASLEISSGQKPREIIELSKRSDDAS